MLAKALVGLHEIDFSAAPAARNSEAAFHVQLQADLQIGLVHYLYNSPCYEGYLKRRFDTLLARARGEAEPARSATIKLLLASADPG
eukprot:3282062-Alexandrium_andersonii.AAC.1